MAKMANTFKLGLFVTLAILLLIIILVLLGSLKFMQPKMHAMTIVSGSVQGLSIGAKVKYNGVPVGMVTEVKLSPGSNQVFIYMDINLDKFIADRKLFSDSEEEFKRWINKGLRCQLRYEGITGYLYVEMAYMTLGALDKGTYKIPPEQPFYIPSAPTVLMGSILEKINTSLGRLSKIDVIINQATETVETVNKFLNGPELDKGLSDMQSISNNINSISDRLNSIFTEKRLKKIVKEAIKAINDIDALAVNINKDLKESNIPSTVSKTRKFIESSQRDLSTTVRTLTETLHSINQLVNAIKKNPDSLLWGEKSVEVVPPK